MSISEHYRYKAVIFDLDGTLIDSAPSILAGLEIAIKKYGVFPAIPMTSSLVGPPLKDTLKKLIGARVNVDLNAIASDFKSYYDVVGFKASRPYAGIRELLNALIQLNISLYLATNKRLEPTLKIVNHLRWSSYFNKIYAIDKLADLPYVNKAEMIQALVQAELIEKPKSVYVGDRIEDLEAALANGMDAILVNWGYGDLNNISSKHAAHCASSPEELLDMIVRGW